MASTQIFPVHPAKTHIMGVLNVTPDSFSDGGEYFGDVGRAVARVKTMLAEGADSIDIGGESTRPGAKNISTSEELKRVLPVIETVRKELGRDAIISIDTYKAVVAQAALKQGANIVNSMGGFAFDPTLAAVVAQYGCPIIVYHIKGQPKTMQTGDITYTDVIGDISAFFEEQIAFGMRHGLVRDQYILDPGIGFGKTVAHNLEIIKRLWEFQTFKLPILVGVSRKSHLGFVLKDALKLVQVPPPTERLEAALAETAVAVLHGATIIRTHDVAATLRCVALVDAIKQGGTYADKTPPTVRRGRV